MNERIMQTCCFFGHRKIKETSELKENLTRVIASLIEDMHVTTFLFGSKSEFDNLCHDIVTTLKEKYPQIIRVYVRAAYADIGEPYARYLLEGYEETYFPEKVRGAGKAVYIERNRDMIDNAMFCVVFYDENYEPPKRKNSKKDIICYQPKSGTKIAYEYAIKKGKKIINLAKK